MKAKLLDHLKFLTEIRPSRNWGNHNSLACAATYIQTEFENYGLRTSQQKWSIGNFEYSNIIASYQPELKKRLIVGAHYDVYGNQPGADDNASGVSGMLYLAESIANEKPNLPYGIDFVAYCLEEPPHFATKNMGSYVHAESLFNNQSELVGMICLDMIGYFSDTPHSQQYPLEALSNIYPTTGNYIAVIGIRKHSKFANIVYQRMLKVGAIDVQSINFETNTGIAGLSDHRNYWHFGYDAVMINNTAKFRNPNYHQITDTLETLDMNRMAAVVKSVYAVISTPITNDLDTHTTQNDIFE